MASPFNQVARLFTLQQNRTIPVRQDLVERDKIPPAPVEEPATTEAQPAQNIPTALSGNDQGQRSASQAAPASAGSAASGA